MTIKQSSRDPGTPHSTAGACWRRERNRPTFTVDTAERQEIVLPYAHFVSSTLSRSEEADTLRIVFFSHQVVVTGSRLEELSQALQEQALTWVGISSARYHTLGGSSGAFVSAIQVIAQEPSQR